MCSVGSSGSQNLMIYKLCNKNPLCPYMQSDHGLHFLLAKSYDAGQFRAPDKWIVKIDVFYYMTIVCREVLLISTPIMFSRAYEKNIRAQLFKVSLA